IGMVASFKRQKGHHTFLKMAQRVREVIPDAWFLVVGNVIRDDLSRSSRYQDEIKKQARAAQLENRCRFLPNQSDIKALYNACAITALLSTREGTPNVLLESMACGVPVIASNVADNAMLVSDGVTGRIVDQDDAEAAAACAIALLSKPE